MLQHRENGSESGSPSRERVSGANVLDDIVAEEENLECESDSKVNDSDGND